MSVSNFVATVCDRSFFLANMIIHIPWCFLSFVVKSLTGLDRAVTSDPSYIFAMNWNVNCQPGLTVHQSVLDLTNAFVAEEEHISAVNFQNLHVLVTKIGLYNELKNIINYNMTQYNITVLLSYRYMDKK